MTKLTNYTPGPKGVHAVGGLVYIAPGQTSDDLEISDGELKAAKATGWFSKPKDRDEAPAEPAPAPAPVVKAEAKGGL